MQNDIYSCTRTGKHEHNSCCVQTLVWQTANILDPLVMCLFLATHKQWTAYQTIVHELDPVVILSHTSIFSSAHISNVIIYITRLRANFVILQLQ